MVIYYLEMKFTTYVTSWGTDPVSQVKDMIAKGALKFGCRVTLAFASFNFDSATYIPGLTNMTMDSVKNFVSTVHGAGGLASLSIGGATYPLSGSDLYNSPGFLASNINTVLTACGFDGVDFDIEDSYSAVPANFATTAASLINTLRSLNPGLYISLTTPAQAWAAGMYQQNLLNLTVGNLDCWQPMEYDLWIDSAHTYSEQIQWDVDYYMKNWGVAGSKIVLGLMPGPDDMSHVLSLQDALNLTSYAKGLGLQGVMTWDLNIDAAGVAGNAPYAYTMGLQSLVFPPRNVIRGVGCGAHCRCGCGARCGCGCKRKWEPLQLRCGSPMKR
uniref:GH18 domain-containing protein n=1 Tax=viral metagenome TaxID=1070528 RepID=A0A6C0KXI2_9ZZZZ